MSRKDREREKAEFCLRHKMVQIMTITFNLPVLIYHILVSLAAVIYIFSVVK